MSPQSCMVTSEECGCTGESESRMKVKWKTSHPMMQQQHVNHSVLNHKYWIWHLHMATYSSSRCLCDSTMVTGQCGRGRDQLFEGESCAAAALSSVRRWAVLIQATRARTSRVLQLVGSWVSSRQKKTQTERRGTQESAPPWTAWLQGQEKWRACRPVTSQVYTASEEREEGGKVNIRYAWQRTWRVGGDENVYRPEEYCINVCTSLYADKMAEGPVNNKITIRILCYYQKQECDSHCIEITPFL